MRTSRLVPICIIFCIMLLSAQPVVYGCEKKPIVTPSKVKVFNEKHSVFRFEEQISLDSWGVPGLFYRVNVYAVKLGNNYLLIDTGYGTLFTDLKQKLLETFGKKPIAVLITHGHADHASAGLGFQSWEVPVYAPEEDINMIIYSYGYTPIPFDPEDMLYGLIVIGTPGHTKGCVSFFDPSSKRLFSSDTTISKPNDVLNQYDMTWVAQNETLVHYAYDRTAQLESLEMLQTYKSIAIYPGHGQVYYKWEQVSSFIQESIDLVKKWI